MRKTTKWEIAWYSIPISRWGAKETEEFKKYGENEWELVAVTQTADYMTAYFKREKKEVMPP